jgi:hypothetical protein
MTASPSPTPDRAVIISSDWHAGIPQSSYRQYLKNRYQAEFDDYNATLTTWWENCPPFASDAMEDREAMASRYHFADSAGLDALQPIANRVAPAIDDVVHSLSPEEVEILLTEAATSGRILAAGHLRGGGDAEVRVIQ